MLPRVSAAITSAITFVLLGTVACGKAEPAPTTEVVTQASLDSLPRLTVSDGRALCVADGRSACPLESAFANWLGDEGFALWEPGRPVMIWRGKDSVAAELGATDGDMHSPTLTLAVASDGSGYQMIVTGAKDRLLHFKQDGKVSGSSILPLIPGSFSRGFTGDVPLLERMRGAKGDDRVHFELDVMKSPMDTSGRPIIRMVLPWLKMSEHDHPEPAPFFPSWPSFGVDRDGGVAWSPGDRFVIHRINAHGDEEWALNGDFPGAEIASTDMTARRAQALAPNAPEHLSVDVVDTMAARTGKFLPAITGLLVSRQGEIMVTGPESPARDSIACYRVSRAGKLLGQFRLPRRTRALIFAGDSVLVHRPTEGEPWEVRWLKLKATP
jgi:hypothetical protein